MSTPEPEMNGTPEPEPFRPEEFLAGRGIDPAGIGKRDPLRKPPFDPVAFRAAQARATVAARVPARFADATADHAGVLQWIARILAGDALSLLVVGPTGTGKTHQCWGAIRAVVEGLAQRGEGIDWAATTHPDLNAAMRVGSGTIGLLERLMRADLVLVDDLGAGRQNDWTGDTLYRLVDHRWSRQLPTIYSTNLVDRKDNPALTNAVGDRVVSRLGDAMLVAMVGPDRRWRRAS